MKLEVREQARQLRSEGMSVRVIAQTLRVSRGSVSVWVRDIELTEEQKIELKNHQRKVGETNVGGQANRQIFMEKRIGYQEVGRVRAREGSPLHLMGCMLYWAEGGKTRRNSVDFANSDPNMMRLFIKFLREEMNVQDEWFRIQIHCHTFDVDEIKRIENYWLNVLALRQSALKKTQVKQGSETRINRLENGVCAIQVHRSEIIQQIYGAIQEYGGFENPNWLL